MARVQVPVVAADAAGNVVSGASIAIVSRASGQAPTVYTTETGSNTRTLPLTTGPNGRPPVSYVDRGAYHVTVTATNVGTDEFDWDATPGTDGGAAGTWLDPVSVRLLARPATVDELPSNPVDGQEVYFQTDAMAGAGVRWHLIYRAGSSSAYKWEVLGGRPLKARATGGSRGGSTIAWGDLSSGPATSPSLTLPLDGDYEMQFGATMNANAGRQDSGSGTGEAALMALAYNGTLYNPGGDGSSDGVIWSQNATVPPSAFIGVNQQQTTPSEPLTMTNRTAETVVTAKYRAWLGYGGTGPGFAFPWITAMPIRVG